MFEKLKGAIDTVVTKATTKELTEKSLADAVWELQLVLIQNDVAVEVAEHVCELTKKKILGTRTGRLENTTRIMKAALHEAILEVLTPQNPLTIIDSIREKQAKEEPTSIMFVGVNGTGKTTTLAKIAKKLQMEGFSIVIAAGDTFRAGSIEQLQKHADNLGIRVIKQQYGSDAAAVAYDAVAHATSKKIDVVLIDTAGRMQANKNLINEMRKIARVADPDIKLFVGDALAGNDVLSQAKEFHEAIEIDGAILTKVDADPSGGAALSITFVTGRPIVYVGVGQTYEDLQPFDPVWFAERLIQ